MRTSNQNTKKNNTIDRRRRVTIILWRIIINNDQNISKRYNDNVIISQSNNYDITFDWNGEEYELVLDASFWIQPYPVESFINKLSQQYANDVIITESQKIGFQPIKSKQHTDGSNTITLQRWNANTSYSSI